jgi:hypothetical protein
MKEKRLGFCFPFSIRNGSIYVLLYIKYLKILFRFPYIYIEREKMELTENGNVRLFAANGSEKRKFLFLGR